MSKIYCGVCRAAQAGVLAFKAFFCKWGSFFFKWVSNLVFLASCRNTMNHAELQPISMLGFVCVVKKINL